MSDRVNRYRSRWSPHPTHLGFWASIGIEKGKPLAPDARSKKILTEAAEVGDATARAMSLRMREKEGYYYDQACAEDVHSSAHS